MTQWFLRAIQEAVKEKNIVTIGLPGGHSLDGWYASVIANRDAWQWIDISCLRWCMVDERCVVPESSDRNDRYVFEVFLKPLGFTLEQFLCFWMSEVDALEYSEIIGTPDVAIFGLWPDWHIASLFPHHPVLNAQVEWYVVIHDAPKLPAERISLSPMSIQKIPQTALFVVWPEKQKAFADFLNPEKNFIDCPAKILHPDIIFQQ